MFESKLEVGGQQLDVRLQIPRYQDISFLLWECRDEKSRRLSLIAEFVYIIQSVNGADETPEVCAAIHDDPKARIQLLASRSRLIESFSEQGRLYALCPHCQAWEAEVTVPALVLGLGSGPWPIFVNGQEMNLPALSVKHPRAIRPFEMSYSNRLRFELPSSVLGLSTERWIGTLAPPDPAKEKALLERKPWLEDVPEEDEDRLSTAGPGFRAQMRLSLMLGDFGPGAKEVTLRTVGRLSATDFFFLDNLYYMTNCVDVVGNGIETTCRSCQKRFVPVQALP